MSLTDKAMDEIMRKFDEKFKYELDSDYNFERSTAQNSRLFIRTACRAYAGKVMQEIQLKIDSELSPIGRAILRRERLRIKEQSNG